MEGGFRLPVPRLMVVVVVLDHERGLEGTNRGKERRKERRRGRKELDAGGGGRKEAGALQDGSVRLPFYPSFWRYLTDPGRWIKEGAKERQMPRGNQRPCSWAGTRHMDDLQLPFLNC